ncbi:MAG: hypothetical protein AVDCRST_MAG68-4637 [uncultured Gemmatimonadetes bacterium]|uniref:DUF4062 domain-containing protein n=1 Tax=uncultured Gemmatimonadota bacterium TaxID=203437 RepID=A0A6J4MM61_9BACT|nr:MAG: hypothetical protein AVDCRST_MAG68-4637 [uncultured Gemmatimonadota bacterium]
MPRIETVFRLFVASPSDVAEERSIVDEVVNEMNLTWSKHFRVRVETVRWETHAFPAIGEDAQSVINRQIDDEYDIFLGVLWTRFGKPTLRYGSGTVEEFERAYVRYEAEPSAIRIMFYFKTAPVDPYTLDPEQLKRIGAFRSRLGEKGALYWNFSSREEFATLLRLHLSRQVQELAELAETTGAGKLLENARLALGSSSPDAPESDGSDEEAGLLDLVQQGVSGFESMTEVITELAFGMSAFNTRVLERTKEFELASANAGADPRPLWRAAKAFADDTEAFAARIDQLRPAFASASEATFASLSGAVALSTDFDAADATLRELLANLHVLNAANDETQGMLTGFRDAVTNQPRISAPVNRAKRRLSEALGAFLDEFNRSLNLGRAVEHEIQELIGGWGETSPEESTEP